MLRYDDKTALIVVDVQNDFADPAGSLAVARGDAIVPLIDSEIEMATGQGALVVLTQDWHPASTPHFKKDGGIWPVHCVADTWGAQLHPDLTPPRMRARIRKGANGEDGYSGFTMRDPVTGETVSTELETPAARRRHRTRRRLRPGDRLLRQGDRARCRAARLRHGCPRRDAIAAVNLEPDDGTRALEEMRDGGVTMWRTVMR